MTFLKWYQHRKSQSAFNKLISRYGKTTQQNISDASQRSNIEKNNDCDNYFNTIRKGGFWLS